jgi:hypothetical protein
VARGRALRVVAEAADVPRAAQEAGIPVLALERHSVARPRLALVAAAADPRRAPRRSGGLVGGVCSSSSGGSSSSSSRRAVSCVCLPPRQLERALRLLLLLHRGAARGAAVGGGSVGPSAPRLDVAEVRSGCGRVCALRLGLGVAVEALTPRAVVCAADVAVLGVGVGLVGLEGAGALPAASGGWRRRARKQRGGGTADVCRGPRAERCKGRRAGRRGTSREHHGGSAKRSGTQRGRDRG